MEALQNKSLDLYPLCLLLGSHYNHVFFLQTKMIKSNTGKIREIKRESAGKAVQHSVLSKQYARKSIQTGLLAGDTIIRLFGQNCCIMV